MNAVNQPLMLPENNSWSKVIANQCPRKARKALKTTAVDRDFFVIFALSRPSTAALSHWNRVRGFPVRSLFISKRVDGVETTCAPGGIESEDQADNGGKDHGDDTGGN